MRGITLRQPYASLIAVGAKTIETRSWQTSYRGPLLIHAARKWDSSVASSWGEARLTLFREQYDPPEVDGHLRASGWTLEDTLGHVLAVARLADCRPMAVAPDRINGHFGTFGPGRFGWVLQDVTALLLPVPWRGTQGMWPVPDRLRGLVQGALPEGRWPGEAS